MFFCLFHQFVRFPVVCVTANGLLWCHHPTLCGEPCTSTCAAHDLVPADDATTFSAQNSIEACTNISLAFGLETPVRFSGFTVACLEDSGGEHSEVPIALIAPLFCSSTAGCPAAHRTNMDQIGIQCNSGTNSRLSICACAGKFQSFHVNGKRTGALISNCHSFI